MKKSLLIFMLFMFSQANAASFDCSKAVSLPEIMICNDNNLSKMDAELGVLYEKAKNLATDKKQFKKQSDAIWQWREENCQTRECVASWLEQRKISLERTINESTEKKTEKITLKLDPEQEKVTDTSNTESSNTIPREYMVPPIKTTSAYVPWIPDEEMEKCVKKYNQAIWLAEEISKIEVDEYSQSSIDAYNLKVTNHSKLIGYFNDNCAGKQSESAYKAAQKLTAEEKDSD